MQLSDLDLAATPAILNSVKGDSSSWPFFSQHSDAYFILTFIIYKNISLYIKLDFLIEINYIKYNHTTYYKHQVVDFNSFSICDTTEFAAYEREGMCDLVKVPVTLKFKSFQESLMDPVSINRESLDIVDLSKPDRPHDLHVCLVTMFQYYQQ